MKTINWKQGASTFSYFYFYVICMVIFAVVLGFLGFHQKEASASISEITFNGVAIDSVASADMKNPAEGTEHMYEFNDISIDTDQNDIICGVGVSFNAENDLSENGVAEDINICYRKTRLKSLDDIIALFGAGNTTRMSGKTVTTYTDGDYQMSLLTDSGKIIDVFLTHYR